ncbi:MAG TPA: ATP-binding protein [Levilinea sp.]|nr:ATP-binding protein [Levilinea sp.]
MSLRLRLTLVYTSLLGGVLLIFGTLVYGMVSVVLLDQVDTTLEQSAGRIITRLRILHDRTFDPRSLAEFPPVENLIIQVWGPDRDLHIARPARFRLPLNEVGLSLGENSFASVQANGLSLRVLTVPIESSRGPAGVLQAGLSLSLIDITQRTLASVLVMLIVFAMLLSGLAAWLVTGQALAPLALVTEIAANITRADDLQRRIPQSAVAGDEVGTLIQAFNQTLERLEKLFTTQRRFLADVSHELRTPLTVIKGNVGLIRRAGEVDEESLSSIEAEVDRLARMVGDLLLLAQVESGRLPLELAPIELDTVLLEVFGQMRMLAGERIYMKVIEIDQVQIMGDRDRIKQVIINLVANALQYTPSGGVVSITLRKVAQQVQLVVQDNGPGIPANDLPHIFERFYRGEKSRRRARGTGFGLGLSIAYWIVRSHSGTIDVISKEGLGTTFTVLLPLYEPPAS